MIHKVHFLVQRVSVAGIILAHSERLQITGLESKGFHKILPSLGD